ncbi:hypothetical protein [Bradyrhizobium ivorense]|uniref:hypothetical protein n=1 Tax=Bradyrhizobium ivorense TaxID=2511166 RepID=UPI003FD6F7DE
MQRNFFWGRRCTLQFLRDPLSFGSQGRRSRTKNGWVAKSFCDRVNQSVDFPVQLSQLLLKTLSLRN